MGSREVNSLTRKYFFKFSACQLNQSPQAGQRVFNKILILMRVPIENGSGFFNQVSDFIKLPAALRNSV